MMSDFWRNFRGISCYVFDNIDYLIFFKMIRIFFVSGKVIGSDRAHHRCYLRDGSEISLSSFVNLSRDTLLIGDYSSRVISYLYICAEKIEVILSR